jgi:hypothetical protein
MNLFGVPTVGPQENVTGEIPLLPLAWTLVMACYSRLQFLWAAAFCASSASAAVNVWLADVPDYAWHAGCFGTATGNLIGYWDRHGLPNMYTGPTGGGLAPLNTVGANQNIRSLWASEAGLDGRPANQPGHMDDYWQSYESTAPDPYAAAGRTEHAPDCLGDFMGASQRKYPDLDGECAGNIDAFAFIYWDKNGDRLANFEPPLVSGLKVRDVPSGLRAFSRYRGYDANVAAQLADFNPTVPAGRGFSFEDLKVEINAGYPVLLILQNYDEPSRTLPGMPRANPMVHAMVAYGYVETDGGMQAVRYRTSWASGDVFSEWNSDIWQAALPVRGLITYHPQPKIKTVDRSGGEVRIQWDGPSSTLLDMDGNSKQLHFYIVERADSLTAGSFVPVTQPSAALESSFSDSGGDRAFFRVKLVPAE